MSNNYQQDLDVSVFSIKEIIEAFSNKTPGCDNLKVQLIDDLEGYDWLEDDSVDRDKVQTFFFFSVFVILGYLSEVDGQLDEGEQAFLNHFMRGLGLTKEHKYIARVFFAKGEQAEYEEIYDLLLAFEELAHDRKKLLELFIEIAVSESFADGRSHYMERQMLDRMAKIFHIPQRDLAALEEKYKTS